ncbi:hypothetical protein Nepgr_009326 [Nepenthes gracilis]|uniref:Uncharacterized protein n=1 Tax=Nepenthes gracilis TaxID=150966 RepID=A0AAD3XK99_NEPGR|nr:hypothetical protein Nepgr_009326 [Nepenthes gracilis]
MQAPDEVDPFNALSALFQSAVVNGRAQFASLREENGRLQQRVAQLEALLVASKARVTRLVGDMVGRYSPSETRRAMEARYWDGIRLCRRIFSLAAPHIPEGVLQPGNVGIEEASRLKTFPEEGGPSSLPN